MACYSLNPVASNSKLWILAIYFYLAPLLASDILILSTGHLVGDFTHVEIDTDVWELLFLSILYILPLIVIIGLFRHVKDRDIRPMNNNFASYLLCVLVIVTASTLIFGTVPVGEAPTAGFVGVIQSLVLKFNPYLLLLLLTSLHTKTWRMFAGVACVLIVTIAQKSLLGYFVSAMALSVYWVDKKSPSYRQLIIYMIISTIILVNSQPLLLYIYSLRSESREFNVEMLSELVSSYAVGRVNSISSLYTIWNGNCCTHAPDALYAIATIFERLTGISFSGISNPGQVFNRDILGVDSETYSIFTGVAGAVLVLAKTSWVALCLNILTLVLVMRLIYWLIPPIAMSKKKPIFLIILYLPYLSGDVWELSMLTQSLLIIRFIYWASIHQTKYK